jgi:hypothetical protein
MDMSKIGRNEWFAIGGTVVVVLGVLIGPWYTISFGPISASASAWDVNAGGKLAFLAMLVMIAAIVVKFLPNPPDLPVSADVILLGGAIVVLVMAVIDFLMHSGHAGWGIYVSIVGALLAGFGAFASGARLSMPTTTGGGTTGGTTGGGPSSEA